MNFNDYQLEALKTARSPLANDELFHLLLGLGGEVGEIQEKAKKVVRDNNSDFDTWGTDDLTKELGDVLWYLAILADYFDIRMEAVATKNIEKLRSRQARNKLGGSGDNR